VVSAEPAGDGVAVQVSDTGPGLARDVDVFAPLVTTKPGGSGLGLAIVRQIVEAHGGHIEVVDQPQGARFRVVLPTTAPRAAPLGVLGERTA
jgi:signal transduction histidine kinase